MAYEVLNSSVWSADFNRRTCAGTKNVPAIFGREKRNGTIDEDGIPDD